MEEKRPLDDNKLENSDASPEMLSSIVAAETEEKKDENVLDIAPEVDTTLLAGLEPQKNVQLLIFKILFALLLFLGLVTFVFFQTQLSDTFKFLSSSFNIPNITLELEEANGNIRKHQTDLNYYRFLQINSYLTELSYYGDAFIQNYEILNSQTATERDKTNAQGNLSSLRNSLREVHLKASELMAWVVYVPIVDLDLAGSSELIFLFEEDLKDKMRAEANIALENSSEENNRDHKNNLQTLKLVGDNDLKAKITATDFDSLSDEDLYLHLRDLNRMIVNDLSIIQEIKNGRIKWSDIMSEIDLRTMEVDSSYSGQYYDLKGGIRYSAYDFDQDQKRISIIGEVMRYDTANFTMLANLVDSFNDSLIFEGAEMKSFSKSGSVEDGYKSSVKLNLGLIEPGNEQINK